MLEGDLQAFHSEFVSFQLHVEDSVLLLKTLNPLLKLFPADGAGWLEAVWSLLLALYDSIKTASVTLAGAVRHHILTTRADYHN